jgi:flavin reductase (DIM6/NTAB) family NADH-FMN oxidoreductase RutF
MSIDSLIFRETLASLAAAVCVVTATHKDKPIGITVSSFASLSLKPPLVLFCLDNASKNLGAFTRGKKFAVNILNERQKTTAHFFAQPDKKNWDTIVFDEDENGTPLLKKTIANLSCTVTAKHKAGDHTIIIGAVDAIDLNTKKAKPLLYFRRNYHALGDVSA